MALLYGPRLSIPSSNSLKLWARFDGAATIKLEVRVNGETAWTLADTQAVETSKSNTVIVEATGLRPRTHYDWRVLEDDVEVDTNSTVTMPTTGRFVMYHLSDQHEDAGSGNAATLIATILSDWETNYLPSLIPGFIMYTGDLSEVGPLNTVLNGVNDLSTHLENNKAMIQRLPFVYMADDHDWRGNNSSKDNTSGSGNMTEAVARDIQDHMWRDRPQPASPSYGFSFTVCDIPFIVADSRSQKLYGPAGLTFIPGWQGNEAHYAHFGQTQFDWLRDQFALYGYRGLCFFVSTTTFVDRIISDEIANFGPAREGISIFYTWERFELAKAMRAGGCAARNNLVILSGDDHGNYCWDSSVGVPIVRTDPRARPQGSNLGLRFREFKVSSNNVAPTLTGFTAFGGGNIFSQNPNQAVCAAVRWDITSLSNGEYATARATYIDQDGTTLVGDADSGGLIADQYFENGHWQAWDTSSVAQTQLHPVDSFPPTRYGFEFSDVDDLNGTLHRERKMVRDTRGRLRRRDDLDFTDRERPPFRTPRPPAPLPDINPTRDIA